MQSATTKFLLPLHGEISIPADKSITHRALIFNALAAGTAIIQNPLDAEDTRATIRVLQQLGISITWLDKFHLQIEGSNGKFNPPLQHLDFANSGTSARICMGLLAAQPFSVTFIGDSSLSQRPMARVLQPLEQMGLKHDSRTTFPITLMGNETLQAIDYALPIPSAQVKTAILLAAIQAHGQTKISLPTPCRNHSEILLQHMGINLQNDQLTMSLRGQQKLQAISLTIPGDFSAAAYWIVAACIIPNSNLTINNVGINPTRIALLDVLKQMGANIFIANRRVDTGELVADIRVLASTLNGVNVPPEVIANLQDEIPILLIAAAFAAGVTEIRGAAELRLKESDRLHAMHQGLGRCGIQSEIFTDGILVRGGKIKSAAINSFGDHRIAMAFLIAGMCTQQVVTVSDTVCINTSYPDFIASLYENNKSY